MVDGGGKGLSEGRRTASPSIRAYGSRPESFPQGYLAPEDCLAKAQVVLTQVALRTHTLSLPPLASG
jgi:hypothetical protein